MPSNDELALTATAAADTTAPESPSSIAGKRATFGRFKVERELGAGGMGIVHAAFDPELERRVALKVLHASSSTARARLLREARAMAKLSHPNVITVFEVGSADGEDFVAMELIDGGTLGDWLDTKPPPRDVIAAFVAAGRGLAAAHAEGLVHRDFKPNNVLRSTSGRILVTDFGLARSDDTEEPVGTPTTGDFKQSAPALTATGAFLGTPAYMSPEQWRSEPTTGATDQFAFCVALWEALAGKHPFEGNSLEELKTDVLRGPDELDASGLPRRLRAVLLRGLALDPAKRWPSITELLKAIERSRSRRSLAIAAGAGVIAAGIGIYVAVHSTASTRSDCVPPAIDPDGIALADGVKPYLDAWHARRELVCAGTSETRTARLACLDGVAARIVDAFHDGAPSPDALGFELVDPAVCDREKPPRLTQPIDDKLARAFAALRKAKSTWKPVDTGLSVPTEPACVRIVALIAQQAPTGIEFAPDNAGAQAKISTQLEATAQICDDDAIRAQAALAGADIDDPSAMRRAEEAVELFPSETNASRLDGLHAERAERRGHPDEEIAIYQRILHRHTVAGRPQLELQAAIDLSRTYLERATAADLAAVVELATKYEAVATAHDRWAQLAAIAAHARWRQGDIAGADRLARSVGYHYGPAPFVDSQFPLHDIKGVVLDEHGAPVAGATVVAAGVMWGDDVELSSSVAHIASHVETTTAADGTFALTGARSTVMAMLGDQVSPPTKFTSSMTLRLGPTSTIEGDVALGGVVPGRVRILAMVVGDQAVHFHTAPIDARGHFKLARIPRGKSAVAAIGVDQVSGFDPPKATPITGPAIANMHLVFDAPAGRLYLIGRSEVSTTPEAAFGMVFRGAHPEAKGTLRQIFGTLGGPVGQITLAPPDPATVAAPFKGHLEPDDLAGELAERPHGDLTICAVAMTRKAIASATSIDKLVHVIQDVDAGCVVVPEKAELATVPIPAVKRQRD